jgi:hypothetical protein
MDRLSLSVAGLDRLGVDKLVNLSPTNTIAHRCLKRSSGYYRFNDGILAEEISKRG